MRQTRPSKMRFLQLLLILLMVAAPCALLCIPAAAAPMNIVRCSQTASGGEADYSSFGASISADGRYVAFQSEATNLLGPGKDNNGMIDVFRKDLQTGQILRCSQTASGREGNEISWLGSISADGRYVAFDSSATNLLGPGKDNDGYADVFRKDLQTGQIVRCSQTASGEQGEGNSSSGSISANGRYVAFESDAYNLLGPDNDNNQNVDVFRKDLQTGEIVRCSQMASGGEGDDMSWTGSISADGRFVAFESVATNLLGPGKDKNDHNDVFRKDLQTGQIVRCSQTASGGEGDGDSSPGSISADGRYVAFDSSATNLLGPGKDNDGYADVFRKDLQTGELVRCSQTASGEEGSGNSDSGSISADGRYVAFGSGATNLLGPGKDNNRVTDAFRKDLRTGELVRCSETAWGEEVYGHSSPGSISANGRYVAFVSDSGNLLGPGKDNNNYTDVFRKDLSVPPLPTPVSITTFYFAEGTCRPNFDPYICIQNPGSEDAKVKITYMKGDGTTDSQTLTVPKNSRSTVTVKDKLGERDDPSHDFSAQVECTNGQKIIAERPMYFNYRGVWTGGHDVLGATTPASTFYFAEGTCRPGFDPYLCIQNPGSADAEVTITYMKGDGSADTQDVTVPKNSRSTVIVKDRLGEGDDTAHDFSAQVECTNGQKIIAERPMYFNYRGVWTGGHDVLGATTPASTFYFAEGTCRPGFDPYLCIQNPGSEDAYVKIIYMKGDGTTDSEMLTVPKKSRSTVTVKKKLGEGDDISHDFSAEVVCTNFTNFLLQRIIVERPMYFNYKGVWTGGHDVVGALAPAKTFYFAEGTCRSGFDSYLCIQNPGSEDADVKIIYMKGDGTTDTDTLKVVKKSRSTVAVKDKLGEGDDPSHDFSAQVECTNGQKIIAERPMYFNYKGVWTGGHDVVGFAP